MQGCHFVYDGDRNGIRAQGNIIKPDFSMAPVPARAFTQHVLNTVDFPFIDMDNPSTTDQHVENDRIDWARGQTSVQNIFSMFTCNAGTANQPPFFVKGLCAGFGSVNGEAHISLFFLYVPRVVALALSLPRRPRFVLYVPRVVSLSLPLFASFRSLPVCMCPG